MCQSADVIGFIDGAAGGEIFGWALDKSAPGEPVLLRVCTGGESILSLLTVEHRADIAAKFGGAGMNGFRVKIPVEFRNASALDISILSENGDHLANSPLRIRRELLIPSTGLPPAGHGSCLLFMHIQKTSGTAFREAIIPNYQGSEILFIYPHPPGVWHDHFHRIPHQQRKTFNCIAGHFVFGFHEEIDKPADYVTILRDPVERVLSHYYHLIRNQSSEVRSAQGRLLRLEEVLEREAAAELDNLIVRCFSGNGARKCPAGMLGHEAYELAIENLKCFRFVGHQESSNGAWQALRQMFGWSKGVLRVINTGQNRPSELSAQARMAIGHYCKYDIKFYEHVLRQWPAHLERSEAEF